MSFEMIEKNGLEQTALDIAGKFDSLNQAFKSSIAPEGGVYAFKEGIPMYSTLSEYVGIETASITPELKASAYETVKNIYNGTAVDDRTSLSLKEIHSWKINPEFEQQNIKQHSGFAAEVIGTAKENLAAKAEKTGVTTYRADDLTAAQRADISEKIGRELKAKNDEYVDKVRVKSDGSCETVQTKFVGGDAEGCFKKLQSKKFDKYINDGKVDKLEIASDHYDEIVNKHIPNERAKLQGQLEKMTAEGNTEKAAEINGKMDRLNNLEKMLEKSTVSSKEAEFAVKHPKAYAAKMAAGRANQAGLTQAKQAAGLTAVVSGVDNFRQYYNGEITGMEALENVAKDTAIAGGMGYVTGAVTELSHSSVPAMAITMGVASYGDVKDFADGKISGGELAYDLGENAASVVGGAVGAAAGTLAGSVAGLVGSFAGGLAGGAVGSAAATKAYGAGVEFISENIDDVKDAGAEVIDAVNDKAVEVGEAVAETAAKSAETVKETAADVREAVSDKLDDAADKAAEVKDTASMTLKNAKVKVTNVIHKK